MARKRIEVFDWILNGLLLVALYQFIKNFWQ